MINFHTVYCEDYYTVFPYTLHRINVIISNLFCHIAGSFATKRPYRCLK